MNDKYKTAMISYENYFKAYTEKKDAYLSYSDYYGWGSNSIKSSIAILYTDLIHFGIDKTKNTIAREIAENYLHYIHGANPLNLVYLSNMKQYGAENSVSQFYHTWFTNGSSLWDQVGVSTYGPPPGFLTGGPNKDYKWDFSACPANPICNSETIPQNEPPMKFYRDINTSWPLNSWEITENSCTYQINYINLLSNYVSLAPELGVKK
ncbi:MAG: glycoside hydrolase family 9 protein [Flavobacterium sp.]